MKRKIITVLLILSLGINLGVLVAFGHHWLLKREFKKWPQGSIWHRKKMQRVLNLNEEQVKLLEQNRLEMQKAITPIREELQKKRADLFALLDAQVINDAQVDKLINDISIKQMEIEKRVVEHLLKVRKNLTPKQWQKLKIFSQKGFRPMPPGIHDKGGI